jgi:hypothetical protein
MWQKFRDLPSLWNCLHDLRGFPQGTADDPDDPVTRGLLVQGSVAGKVQNPLLIVARKAVEAMVAIAGEFGLSPWARARLAATGFPSCGGGSSKCSDLLKG